MALLVDSEKSWAAWQMFLKASFIAGHDRRGLAVGASAVVKSAYCTGTFIPCFRSSEHKTVINDNSLCLKQWPKAFVCLRIMPAML